MTDGPPAALAGVVAAMAAVARFCQAQLAKLKPPAGPAGSSSGVITTVATWARGTLTPWLASLVIVGVGAFLTLLWIGNAARTGYSPSRLWQLYDGAEFEAYQELGVWSVKAAVTAGGLPLPLPPPGG